MKLVASSVVRGGHRDGGQGGLYVIDLQEQTVKQPVDINAPEFDWSGRAREKGFRGIAFDGDRVFAVSNNELLAFTPGFELIDRWQNAYLEHCRGITVFERKLFVTSAGFDSIVGFDLDNNAFDFGLHLLSQGSVFGARRFDPNTSDGPILLGKLDLRDVHCDATGMFISVQGGLLRFTSKVVSMVVELPPGSRDAQPFRNGVLFNDSLAGCLRYSGRHEGAEDRALYVPGRDIGELLHEEWCNDDLAQAGYARGLCLLGNATVAGGSSPAAVSVYDLANNERLLSVSLSSDARTSIHSLAAWPYD